MWYTEAKAYYTTLLMLLMCKTVKNLSFLMTINGQLYWYVNTSLQCV